MTDSNIISRLRKLRFNRRTSPPPDAPSIRSRTSSSGTNLTLSNPKRRPARIDIYHPLEISSQEIRLLHILPEQPGSLLLGPDPIKCVLSHVSLNENPKYHTLSYTWDDESLGESFEDPDVKGGRVMISGFIFLDGQAVEVTPNLWVALWHLRRGANWFAKNPDSQVSEFGNRLNLEELTHFTYDTPIWIDALCINQLDVLERNNQVQMMGSLYREAQCVQSWLGLGVEDIEPFIKVMNTFDETFRERGDALKELYKMLEDESLQCHWNLLPLICNRPYWERLWIVQEFILGRNCALHIGLRVIDAIPFVWVVRMLATAPPILRPSERPKIAAKLPVCKTILGGPERGYSTSKEVYTLSRALPFFRDHKCADPRDKIYSLLGIGETSRYEIRVDYTLGADEVYKDAARKIILRDQDLFLIRNPAKYTCQCPESQHISSPLPSWVPDWKCLQTTFTALVPLGVTLCQAAGDILPNIHLLNNGNVLACSGLLLGSVGKLCIASSPGCTVSSRDLARLALNTPVPVEFALDSDNISLLERLKAVYQALVLEGQSDAAEVLDENAFVQHCISTLHQEHSLNSENPETTHKEMLFAAIFFLDLASPLLGASVPTRPIFGLCYSFCRDGDIIAVLYGSPFLVALRPDPADQGRFKVLGEVYVPGYMRGEAVDVFEERVFELT